ncbi:MAG: creatininase family protein, partial [Gammaproteobacteria bacterium]|nr:creatininase family protein [Gammaproteobacteria bacterium]
FPWTRVAGAQYPSMQKPMLDSARIRALGPAEVRRYLGDGNYGGRYRRSDEDMLALWRVGVEETRAVIAENWQ